MLVGVFNQLFISCPIVDLLLSLQVLVERGTPVGSRIVVDARQHILGLCTDGNAAEEAHILAPVYPRRLFGSPLQRDILQLL